LLIHKLPTDYSIDIIVKPISSLDTVAIMVTMLRMQDIT
jgi:hypothetical protein